MRLVYMWYQFRTVVSVYFAFRGFATREPRVSGDQNSEGGLQTLIVWAGQLGVSKNAGLQVSTAIFLPQKDTMCSAVLFHRLVNRHSTRRRRLQVVHIDTAVVALLLHRRLAEQVRLQSTAVVVHAIECIDDCTQQEENRQHCKSCQTLAHGHVLLGALIDAEEFKDEVGKAAEEEDDDRQGSEFVLVARGPGGAQQDQDRDGHGGNGQIVFGAPIATNNDNELHGEAEEEEEIELEKRNVHLVILSALRFCRLGKAGRKGRAHLIVQKPLLHPVIGTDLLENVPGEHLVQLPRNVRHANGADSQYNGNRDQEAEYLSPQSLFCRDGYARGICKCTLHRSAFVEIRDGLVNLVNLNRRVN